MKTDFEKFALHNCGIGSMKLDGFKRFNNSGIAPVILEESVKNVTSWDVFSRLLYDRIIFLGCDINDDVANIIQAQLLYLSSTDDKSDISLYINSPGGVVSSGLGIYDTMNLIKPDVSTICTGMAASMGAVLLSSGTKGKRKSLKHSLIMLHEPMGGIAGGTKCSDFLIEAEQIKKCKDTLFDILSENCGKSVKEMEESCLHDNWMTAQEAVDFGAIDSILEKGK